MSGKPKLKLQKALGNGHFGRVWLGTDPIHGAVAAKELVKYAGETDAEWKDRLKSLTDEGRSLSAATHDNIVRVFHLERRYAKAPVLVMELCKGGSLGALYQAGPMLPSRVRHIARDVLLGLGALHARGMIHRDIKPGNILLDANGRAKLADFGLVTDQLLFGYASHCGYVDHLSFEVINGTGTSVRSDIWALGMTLYRLLHGHDWYSAQGRPDVSQGGFAKRLVWLQHVSQPWRRLIRKMMHDDPKLRFQDTNEVMNALSRIPITPDWQAKTGLQQVTWRGTKGAKQVEVIWARSAKPQTWSAADLDDAGQAGRVTRRARPMKGLLAFLGTGPK